MEETEHKNVLIKGRLGFWTSRHIINNALVPVDELAYNLHLSTRPLNINSDHIHTSTGWALPIPSVQHCKPKMIYNSISIVENPTRLLRAATAWQSTPKYPSPELPWVMTAQSALS